jgi:hypothetical protein
MYSLQMRLLACKDIDSPLVTHQTKKVSLILMNQPSFKKMNKDSNLGIQIFMVPPFRRRNNTTKQKVMEYKIIFP